MMKKILITLFCLVAFRASAIEDMLYTDGNDIFWYGGSTGVTETVLNQTLAIARTNYVIVKKLADFPTPVGGKIQLPDNSIYEVNGFVFLGVNRIFMGANNELCGANRSTDILSYSGTEAMINGSNSFFDVNTLFLQAPAGQLLDFSNTNGGTFSLSQILAPSPIGGIGSIDGFANLLTFECIYGFMSNGLTLHGLGGENLIIDRQIFSGQSNTNVTYIDFGTSTWETVVISKSVFRFPQDSLVEVLSGLPGNSNLTANGTGLMFGNTFHSEGTFCHHTNYITGMTHSDVQWRWSANQGADDSEVIGGMVTTNVQEVTINTQSVPELVSSYWVGNDLNERFVFSVDRLTYTGLSETKVSVTVSATLSPSSGTNKDLEMYLFINGVEFERSKSAANADSGTPQRFVIAYPLTLETGDYIQIYVENEDGTQNIDVDLGLQVMILD